MNEKSEVRKAATPKKQGPPKTANSELNEKLHQMELGETSASASGMPASLAMSTPSGLPGFLSQYGVASQSQSESQEIRLPGSHSASNTLASSAGSGTATSADSRPKKIRKVSVVSKPLKV